MAEFDPVPRELQADVAAGRLKQVDGYVYAAMLSFRVLRKDSCWCAKRTIAYRVRKSERTVQSSWGRLKEAGWIAHARVETPDPDDPRNLTGWRFVFPRIASELELADRPSEVGRGAKNFSPPSGTATAAETDRRGANPFSEKRISPKEESGLKEEEESTFNVPPGLPPAGPKPGQPGSISDRQARAAKLLKEAAELHRWELTPSPDGRRIIPKRCAGYGNQTDLEEVRPEWEQFKPELLELLRCNAAPALSQVAPGEATAADDVYAPKVPRKVRAKIRDLGKRIGAGDGTAAVLLADLLVETFRDRDPELSRRRYLEFLTKVASGIGPESQSWLIECLGDSMGPRVRNRGALFISRLKHLSAQAHREREFQPDHKPSKAGRTPRFGPAPGTAGGKRASQGHPPSAGGEALPGGP